MGRKDYPQTEVFHQGCMSDGSGSFVGIAPCSNSISAGSSQGIMGGTTIQISSPFMSKSPKELWLTLPLPCLQAALFNGLARNNADACRGQVFYGFKLPMINGALGLYIPLYPLSPGQEWDAQEQLYSSVRRDFSFPKGFSECLI